MADPFVWHLRSGNRFGPNALLGQVDLRIREDDSVEASLMGTPEERKRRGVLHPGVQARLQGLLDAAGYPNVPLLPPLPDSNILMLSRITARRVETLPITSAMRQRGGPIADAANLLEKIADELLDGAENGSLVTSIVNVPFLEPRPRVEIELPFTAEIAAVVRKKHEIGIANLSSEERELLAEFWFVLPNAADLRDGAYVSDGENIHWVTEDGFILHAANARQAPSLAPWFDDLRGGSAAGHFPRLYPLGSLGDRRTAWLLRGYWSRRGSFQLTHFGIPVVYEPLAEEPLRALVPEHVPQGLLGGSEPQRLFPTADPDIFVIQGEVDGGALAHLDDFIPVSTGYALDLKKGTFRSAKNQKARRPKGPFLAVSTSWARTDAEVKPMGCGNTRLARQSGRYVIRVPRLDKVVSLEDPRPEARRDEIFAEEHAGTLAVLDTSRADRLVAYAFALTP